jgi:hypothetical protein
LPNTLSYSTTKQFYFCISGNRVTVMDVIYTREKVVLITILEFKESSQIQ